VTGLIDATTGTTSGQFDYGPFGDTIRLTPNSNNQSPFRFSTKYQDDESDFLYYGFRYYNPSTGRWLSRDPVTELSFNQLVLGPLGLNSSEETNLFGMVRNDPPNELDILGLQCKCGPDVTAAVHNTLLAIANAFNSSSIAIATQRKAAESLYLHANAAWDIVELNELGQIGHNPFKGSEQGTGECERTVVFEGNCVYASALNYISFGKMNRLAHDKFASQPVTMRVPGIVGGVLGTLQTVAGKGWLWGGPAGTIQITWSYEDAVDAATYRKHFQLGDFSEEATQAINFTIQGYGRPITGRSLGQGKCDRTQSKPIREQILHGHFGPISF
jgi:RHS repeat-associated protein